MKPHRLTLTNALIFGYDLGKRIDHIYNPRLATKEELEAYHDHDYVDFLSRCTTTLCRLSLHTHVVPESLLKINQK